MSVPDRRTYRLEARITRAEKSLWTRAAAQDDRSLSDWVRLRLDEAARYELRLAERQRARRSA